MKIKLSDLNLDDDFGPSIVTAVGNRCLKCDELLDGASPIGDKARPKDGDVSMCMYCGHLMAFTKYETLRELRDDERAEVESHPDVQKLIKARENVKRTDSHKAT